MTVPPPFNCHADETSRSKGETNRSKTETPRSSAEARYRILAQRYFAAETSAEDEARLARFLATREGQAACFDEVRAAMSFAAVGRQLARRDLNPKAGGSRLRRTRLRSAAAAAAAVAACGLLIWAGRSVSPAEIDAEACVAYVGGRKVTDREAVVQQMRRSMARVAGHEPAPGVEEQLGAMFALD
ncbi:MAG: hypothetical protein J1F06_02015 [Prevotellaceae bacterium]|nr:hypothetical protein [Prevotellaceae bacterium]